MQNPGRRLNLARWAMSGALVLAATMASAADPARQWILQGDEAFSSLIFGTPESDDVVLSLTCDHATKLLTVWYATEPAGGKAPEKLEMAFKSEGGTLRLTGTGRRSEMDNVYALEAATPFTPAVEKLLADARTLTIVVENRSTAFTMDATAHSGIATLQKGCLR